MKVLFIGGTGNISAASTRLAVANGMDVYLLNRGKRNLKLDGVTSIVSDIKDEKATASALEGRTWDAVVNWIAFTPEDIERDIRLFQGKTGQYIFISSASAYQKPLAHPIVTEDTPLANPYWDYSRNKIACEERLNRNIARMLFPLQSSGRH